jgi:hypothetical protein
VKQVIVGTEGPLTTVTTMAGLYQGSQISSATIIKKKHLVKMTK